MIEEESIKEEQKRLPGVSEEEEKPTDEAENINEKPKKSEKKNKGKNNKIHMLRYGTAVLAFLSMLTTAEGMKDFVFAKAWMAYLGSMAVQMILVVFSLSLCKLYVNITKQKSWKTWVRRAAITGLTLFFVISMFVSSVFSFSYISNNAYHQNWSSDRNIMIDNYLTLETDRLRRENEYRGEVLLGEIREIAESNIQEVANELDRQLSTEISAAVMNSEQHTGIDNFFEKYTYLQEDAEGFLSGQSVENEWRYNFDPMRALYGQGRLQELEILIEAYRLQEDYYAAHIKVILDILNDINDALGNDARDGVDLQGKIELSLTKLDNSREYLERLKDGIDGIENYYFDRDFETPRTIFRSRIDELVVDVDMLADSLAGIQEQIKVAMESVPRVDSNHIISEIYALGLDDSIQVETIQTELGGVVEAALERDAVDSAALQKIVELLDLVVKYKEHLVLESRIEEFESNNLAKTYQIDNGEKEMIGGDLISEREWSEYRKNDFFVFISMVKELPAIDKDKENGQYDIGVVISEANEMHRDLLGELTDLERAVLHFKYKHKVMAIFSLFMAVFLDLGSFLTGCLIYMNNVIKKKKFSSI